MKINFPSSPRVKIILGIVGALVILLVTFQLGVFVGMRKGLFASRWGENYQRNFIDGRRGERGEFWGGMMGRGFKSHGAVAKIIKIELPNITVAGGNDAEKILVIDSQTVIQRFKETIPPADLKVGDNIVAIGAPNSNGQIETKLIRVLPAPGL